MLEECNRLNVDSKTIVVKDDLFRETKQDTVIGYANNVRKRAAIRKV